MDARTRFLATLAGTLLAVQSVQAGEMYRWTDEHGKVHYTDRAPTGVNTQVIATKPAPRPGGATLAQGQSPEEEEDPRLALDRRKLELEERRFRDEQEWRKREEARTREQDERRQAERDAADQRRAERKADWCKRLKDVADSASGFERQYRRDCR